MNLDLSGKRAMVCGSTQGIGKACAIELAILGASITLVARDEEKLNAVIKELRTSATQKHDYIVTDFLFPDDLKKKVNNYVLENSIAVLVNNTGGPPAGQAIDAEPDEFVQAFSSHSVVQSHSCTGYGSWYEE